MGKKKSTDGFGVNQCSLCDLIKLTIGQQRHGGVRFCQDCFKQTLAWVQMSEEARNKTMSLFEKLSAHAEIQTLIKDGEKISEADRKAMSVGESMKRLYESNF